jgi:hypothetical protein
MNKENFDSLLFFGGTGLEVLDPKSKAKFSKRFNGIMSPSCKQMANRKLREYGK